MMKSLNFEDRCAERTDKTFRINPNTTKHPRTAVRSSLSTESEASLVNFSNLFAVSNTSESPV